MTFTGVTIVGNSTIKVGSFQGPGISATKLWLMADTEAVEQPGYFWPQELQ
jgi:hypothetical protein